MTRIWRQIGRMVGWLWQQVNERANTFRPSANKLFSQLVDFECLNEIKADGYTERKPQYAALSHFQNANKEKRTNMSQI